MLTNSLRRATSSSLRLLEQCQWILCVRKQSHRKNKPRPRRPQLHKGSFHFTEGILTRAKCDEICNSNRLRDLNRNVRLAKFGPA